MSDGRLKTFLERQMTAGESPDIIRRRLIAARWPEDEVDAVLATWTIVDGVAVPRRMASLAAGETFMYLMMFVTFFMGAGGMLDVLFGFTNWLVPPPDGGYADLNVRYGVATLLVSFPVFVYAYAAASRGVRQDPEKRESGPRRWLIYLTLLACSVAALGSLTSFVGGVLAGRGDLNGGIKILTVAALAGVMFWNFLWELRRTAAAPGPTRRAFLWFATSAIVTVIASGVVFALNHRDPLIWDKPVPTDQPPAPTPAKTEKPAPSP